MLEASLTITIQLFDLNDRNKTDGIYSEGTSCFSVQTVRIKLLKVVGDISHLGDARVFYISSMRNVGKQ